MLHDPGSYSPPQRIVDISLGPEEKDVLKRLGQELAAIAALPVHWGESELTLRTVHPWAREQLKDVLERARIAMEDTEETA